MKKIFLSIGIIILFSGCVCLTCSGNGTCFGKSKCTGVGVCKNGYAKCKKIPFSDKPFYATCQGDGVCAGIGSCDGDLSNCTGSGTCQSAAALCAGIPGITYESDIMMKEQLKNHKLSK